jgi:uncharacterized damage-inducible protein DinB
VSVDLLDRLLGHDAWTTRRLLEHCRALDDERLDREHDFAHRSVRATLVHVIRNIEVWTDLMAGVPVRPNRSDEPAANSVDGLIARLDRAADDLAAVARGVRARDGWDERWVDVLDDPPTTKTYGGAIAHVITHSMHHRAQVLLLLREVGVPAPIEGDVLSWEAQAR